MEYLGEPKLVVALVLDESVVLGVEDSQVQFLFAEHAQLDCFLDQSVPAFVFDHGPPPFLVNWFHRQFSFSHQFLIIINIINL